MDGIAHAYQQSLRFDFNRMWIVKVHRTVSSVRNQFCRRNPRFYGNLNHILFMGCKIKSAGFGGWIWYLAGSFAQTGNSIITMPITL